jgi:hypothetical protein
MGLIDEMTSEMPKNPIQDSSPVFTEPPNLICNTNVPVILPAPIQVPHLFSFASQTAQLTLTLIPHSFIPNNMQITHEAFSLMKSHNLLAYRSRNFSNFQRLHVSHFIRFHPRGTWK